MLGVAGFFLLLDSPFVAMFQITVYVGAVAVLCNFHGNVRYVQLKNCSLKEKTEAGKALE